jgi:hypothetical protein
MINAIHISGGHQQEIPRVGILEWGLRPPWPDEDDPTIMAAIALEAGEDGETNKTSSKWAIPITTNATLIPYRSKDTNMRPYYDGGLEDAPFPVCRHFGWCTPTEIPTC